MSFLLLSLILACSTSEPPVPGNGGNNGGGGGGGGGGTDTTEPEPEPEPVEGILLINEVMADNESTLQLDDDSLPDWIELYNPGTKPIKLSDVRIGDDSGAVWEGGPGEVPAGGHHVLYADEGEGDDHLPFSISADGDELLVMVGLEITDELEVPSMPSDVSYQRYPDGADVWVGTAAPSPDDENGAPTETLDPKDVALSEAMVHQIYWEITDAQYDILNSSSEQWAWVEAEIDGIHYDQIDVRLKGSASFDLMDGKPQFKVDVNQYDDAARFREMRGFKLHNGNILDPTRTRDFLTYQLARESGVMAPRVGWAELYVNDNYYGIYMMIEDYDTDMIEEWYPGQGDLGALFEPNEAQGGGWGGDFCSGDPNFNYEVGPIPPDPLVLEALNSASQLCGQVATDERVLELWNHVDKDAFLKYMAWETTANHTDGYKAVNNWRVYVGTDYKIRLVPSGAEWTWDYAPSTWTFGGQLASWCLENTGCKRDYAVEVLAMADRVETLDLHTQFTDLSAWLDPLLQSDPRSPHNATDITNGRASTNTRLQENPGLVRNDVYTTFPGLGASN